MKKLSKEELSNGYDDFLTVGDLKEFLYKNNLSNDAKVIVQRVEDVYFDRHNWKVYPKVTIDTFRDKDGNIVEESLEQYVPAFCCAKYDDDEFLFINLHY